MSRRLGLVWGLAFAGAVLAADTVTAQQFRGYGDGYAAAPNYYNGYGGQGYDPYDAPQPRRFRDQPQGGDQGSNAPPPGYNQGYNQGYNNDPDPGEPGYQPRGRERQGRRDPGDRFYGERDYGYGGGYGYDQGPVPQYSEPNGGGRRASDYDLGENANRTTVTEVENNTRQPPGTIVIDTSSRHLFYTQANGQALQYGIGVGRQGFTWHGTARVERKAEWPDWIPPSDMLKRRPDLPTRMSGGIENPLGARALYLFQGNKDTMFRIHGTNEPDTIGKAVSSGCIRMMNADVIDLYSRVPVGTKVVVL